MNSVEDMLARIRDAEARVEELGSILTTLNALGYLSHWWEESTDARDVKIAAKKALATLTHGAFDRLRNEVLEEAAKIVEDFENKPPCMCWAGCDDCLNKPRAAAETIRAAKKGER